MRYFCLPCVQTDLNLYYYCELTIPDYRIEHILPQNASLELSDRRKVKEEDNAVGVQEHKITKELGEDETDLCAKREDR